MQKAKHEKSVKIGVVGKKARLLLQCNKAVLSLSFTAAFWLLVGFNLPLN